MKLLIAAALLMALTLAGCGYRPSTAECFSFVEGDSPCSFTPVSSEHWKVIYDEAR